MIRMFLIAALVSGFSEGRNVGIDEAKARESFIQRFTNFNKDKNVQGKVYGPDGKLVNDAKSRSANGDDKAPFQSDMTYHIDMVDGEKLVGISEHGKVSAAGGSSLFEREMHKKDEELGKADAKTNQQQNPETGERVKGAMKITTKSVLEDKDGKTVGKGLAPGAKPQAGQNKITVERRELRPEAIETVQKVTDQAFETVKTAARIQSDQNNQSRLGNLAFYYEAAKRATETLWNTTMAKLGQRRIYEAVPSVKTLNQSVTLNQDAPKPEDWAKQANARLSQIAQQIKDPKEIESIQKDIEKKIDQAKQVGDASYKMINPTFTQSNDQNGNPQETLKEGEVNREDGLARDLRVQAEVLAKAGKSATEVESNWEYNKKDEQFTLKNYNESGEEVGTRTTNISEQMSTWNEKLDTVSESYKALQSKLPGLKIPNLQPYYLEPGQNSIVELNQVPDSILEDKKIQGVQPFQNPQNYNTLINTP